MKQTVNPVHLLYNNNRLHGHIVWAPCGETDNRSSSLPVFCDADIQNNLPYNSHTAFTDDYDQLDKYSSKSPPKNASNGIYSHLYRTLTSFQVKSGQIKRL